MPDTFCVGGCKSNYATTIRETGETVLVFSFPSDPEQRKLWIDRLPNIIQYSGSLRVCAKHWSKIMRRFQRMDIYAPLNPHLYSIMFQQTTTPRETKKRKVDSESRTQINNEKNNKKDLICKWDQLVRFCKKLDGLFFLKLRIPCNWFKCREFRPSMCFPSLYSLITG